MKRKILSIALVAMVVLALMVPCFAVTVTIKTEGDNNPSEDDYYGYQLLTIEEIGEIGGIGEIGNYQVNGDYGKLLYNTIKGIIYNEDVNYTYNYTGNLKNIFQTEYSSLTEDIEDAIVLFILGLEDDNNDVREDDEVPLNGVKAREFANALRASAKALGVAGTSIPFAEGSVTIDPGYWLLINDETGALAILNTISGANIEITEKEAGDPSITKYARIKNDNTPNDWTTDQILAGTDEEIEFLIVIKYIKDLVNKGYSSDIYALYDTMDEELVYQSNTTTYFMQKALYENDPPNNINNNENIKKFTTVLFDTGVTDNWFSVNGIKQGLTFNDGIVKCYGESSEYDVENGDYFLITYTAKLKTSELSGLIEKTGIFDLNKGYKNTASLEVGGKITLESVVTVYTTEMSFHKLYKTARGVDVDSDALPEYGVANGAEFTLTKTVDGQYAVFSEKYEYIVGLETVPGYVLTGWVADEMGATKLSFDGGQTRIIGLPEGTYTLSEVENSDLFVIAPIEIEIEDIEEGDSHTIVITATDPTEELLADPRTEEYGVLENIEIPNIIKDGTLPSTGGVGTTIMYIGGSVLLIGAGIALAIYFLTDKRRRYADKIK